MKPQRFAVTLLLAVSFMAMAMAVYSGIRSYEFARCQARVTEQLIASQTGRADAAAADREADREETVAVTSLISQVFTATSAEQTRQIYAAYTTKMQDISKRRAAIEEKRRANPLPAPPSQSCG